MRSLDTRKALQEIKRQCRRSGIECLHDPGRGKGSHQSIGFRLDSGTQVRIVIPGHRELSPGVQRNVLRYVGSLAPRNSLADRVYKILEAAFGLS